MEDKPNNLISNICDAIKSGKNFGGWTDTLNELGYYSKNQVRTQGRITQRKGSLLNKQRQGRERFKINAEKQKAQAKIKDIRQDPRDSLRQRYR